MLFPQQLNWQELAEQNHTLDSEYPPVVASDISALQVMGVATSIVLTNRTNVVQMYKEYVGNYGYCY